MNPIDIIKRLANDGVISIDEFVTLYDAIKSNTQPYVITYPYTSPSILPKTYQLTDVSTWDITL